MCSWLAVCALVLTAGQPPVEPPLVGRPPDFSGAVGGPFVVEQTAAPTELTAEEPLTLTVRITGPGNLRDLPRPPLARLEAYKSFAVDDLDDRFVEGDPPRREFRYRLRPRGADVKTVPRLKFVYFNPRIRPPSRGYQTTYAGPVTLTVKPRVPSAPDVPDEVPEWMLQPATAEEILGPGPGPLERGFARVLGWLGVPIDLDSPGRRSPLWPLVVLALVIPPAVCGVWLVFWRKANPDAARRASIRRSRAAAVALRSLRSATGDPPRQVAQALTGYLHDRVGLPVATTTPAEIRENLSAHDCPGALTDQSAELLRRCDEARYSPYATADGSRLVADAERLILDWEALPWSPPPP
jgi:hypothetical protein